MAASTPHVLRMVMTFLPAVVGDCFVWLKKLALS